MAKYTVEDLKESLSLHDQKYIKNLDKDSSEEYLKKHHEELMIIRPSEYDGHVTISVLATFESPQKADIAHFHYKVLQRKSGAFEYFPCNQFDVSGRPARQLSLEELTYSGIVPIDARLGLAHGTGMNEGKNERLKEIVNLAEMKSEAYLANFSAQDQTWLRKLTKNDLKEKTPTFLDKLIHFLKNIYSKLKNLFLRKVESQATSSTGNATHTKVLASMPPEVRAKLIKYYREKLQLEFHLRSVNDVTVLPDSSSGKVKFAFKEADGRSKAFIKELKEIEAEIARGTSKTPQR